MKILNKKLTSSLILIFILLSTVIYARPVTDIFSGGLIQINNFFENEGYAPYAKAIDFFFFSILFIAIYMMGARYAFKEIKRPEQVIVILLGLMTAFLLVLADISAVILLPYIQWLLYTLLFILYWWLLKGIQNKFWRFVLALLLTILTIALIQGLFNTLTAPQAPELGVPSFGLGGIGGFFKDLFGSFKGIDLGGVSAPGVPPWMKDLFGLPSVTTPTGPTPLPGITTPGGGAGGGAGGGGGIGGTPWYKNQWTYLIPLAILLLALAIWGGAKLRKKGEGKKEEEGKEAGKQQTTESIEIQKIIQEIDVYLKLKYEILKKIYIIYKRKNLLNPDPTEYYSLDKYHKKIKELLDKDASYLLDPDTHTGQDLFEEGNKVHELIKTEIGLGKALVELLSMEYKLSGFKDKKGDIQKWAESTIKEFVKSKEEFDSKTDEYKQYHNQLMAYFNKLVKISDNAKSNIHDYFEITKKHIEKEQELEKLLDPKKLEELVKTARVKQWLELVEIKTVESRNFSGISKFVKDERDFLKKYLFPAINQERGYLRYIKRLIELLASKMEIKVIVQDLKVYEKGILEGEEKWSDITESRLKPGIKYGTEIKVATRVFRGPESGELNPRFIAQCYVYKYASDKTESEIHPGGRPKPPWIPIKKTKNMSSIEFRNLIEKYKQTEEYKKKLEEYEDAINQRNIQLLLHTKPVQKTIEEVLEFESTKDFGTLEPGKYKIVVYVKSILKEQELAMKEDLALQNKDNPNYVNLDYPNALTRYGWDTKHVDIFIQSLPETKIEVEIEPKEVRKKIKNEEGIDEGTDFKITVTAIEGKPPFTVYYDILKDPIIGAENPPIFVLERPIHVDLKDPYIFTQRIIISNLDDRYLNKDKNYLIHGKYLIRIYVTGSSGIERLDKKDETIKIIVKEPPKTEISDLIISKHVPKRVIDIRLGNIGENFKWKDITNTALNPGIKYRTPIKISTKILKGISTLTASCEIFIKRRPGDMSYVMGLIDNPDEMEKIYPGFVIPPSKLIPTDAKEVEFSSGEFGNLALGEYKIYISVEGYDIAKKSIDIKIIKTKEQIIEDDKKARERQLLLNADEQEVFKKLQEFLLRIEKINSAFEKLIESEGDINSHTARQISRARDELKLVNYDTDSAIDIIRILNDNEAVEHIIYEIKRKQGTNSGWYVYYYGTNAFEFIKSTLIPYIEDKLERLERIAENPYLADETIFKRPEELIQQPLQPPIIILEPLENSSHAIDSYIRFEARVVGADDLISSGKASIHWVLKQVGTEWTLLILNIDNLAQIPFADVDGKKFEPNKEADLSVGLFDTDGNLIEINGKYIFNKISIKLTRPLTPTTRKIGEVTEPLSIPQEILKKPLATGERNKYFEGLARSRKFSQPQQYIPATSSELLNEWGGSLERKGEKEGVEKKRSLVSDYKKEFLVILNSIKEDRATLRQRISKSGLAKENMQEVRKLLSELDENIEKAGKTYKKMYLESAKSKIYDLTSLTRDVQKPVGKRIVKNKTLNKSKIK